jgi:fluoride exporter
MINLTEVMLVGAGGFVGSVARHAIAVLIQRYDNTNTLALILGQGKIPKATLAVNLLGSLVLGYLGSRLEKGIIPDSLWLLLAIGFCGGFTTLSTLSYEALKLLQEGLVGTAVAYVITTLVLGVLFCWAGLALGRFLHQ